MSADGHDATIRRAVNDCLELNGLREVARDLDTLIALWPLMRTLADLLYDVPLSAVHGAVEPASGRSRQAR